MSYMPTFKSDKYEDGRTKQAFKDETDVNRLLAKAKVAGGLSHIEKHGAYYGDFQDFDLLDAATKLSRARSIFEELPGELQREFHHSPAEFFEFVATKPEAELGKVFPELAEPGRQYPDVKTREAAIEAAAAAPTAPPVAEPEPADPPPTG